jgi:hypothetical protein
VPDSSLDASHSLSFEELAQLRAHLKRTLGVADRSLRKFHVPATGGFTHKIDPAASSPPSKWSKSSTATCVSFLRATGRLDDEDWSQERARLTAQIAKCKWKSAGLKEDNPFTVAFLLEALADLGMVEALSVAQQAKIESKVDLLIGAISAEEAGGVRLQDYDATAFLTFKAVSALKSWDRLDSVSGDVIRWAWNHLNRESVLVSSGSPDGDVFEVAYSVLVASAVTRLDRMTPQQRFLLHHAIGQFFSAQHEDGSWPRSRPLFVYPAYGHAYCFDYELLAAMLKDPQLRPLIYGRLGELRRAAEGLDARKYPLESPDSDGRSAYGWSSGHHGTDPRPESWSTASALHFCFELNDLVAEGIRIAAFHYAGAPYLPPRKTPPASPALPESFLDSRIQLEGNSHAGLKGQMNDRFIKPLLVARDRLQHGKPLPSDTPSSAILYGPPGTSKTELATLIAKALGWPLLPLDPSHLTRQGLDQVHAEANKLFTMLQQCEQIVVLLDEFDELMRDREGSDLESRFLTTAMLPKLTALSKERCLVYLVATNHLERFDAAIRRPGRFDLIVPVMPPTLQAKRAKWPGLTTALEQIESLGEEELEASKAVLSDLTFSEAKDLNRAIDGLADPTKLHDAFTKAGKACTLRQQVASDAEEGAGDGTWRTQILDQRGRIRLGA